MVTQKTYYPSDNAFGCQADGIADLPEIAGNATAISLLKRIAFELCFIRTLLTSDGNGTDDLELFNRESGKGARATWITADQPTS